MYIQTWLTFHLKNIKMILQFIFIRLFVFFLSANQDMGHLQTNTSAFLFI